MGIVVEVQPRPDNMPFLTTYWFTVDDHRSVAGYHRGGYVPHYEVPNGCLEMLPELDRPTVEGTVHAFAEYHSIAGPVEVVMLPYREWGDDDE